MIDRYSYPEMAALFSEAGRLSLWTEIELLAAEGWVKAGVVPAEVASALRARVPDVDAAFVSAVAERERVTDHDVAAFVDVLQSAVGPPENSWIHFGLTSSDIVDTALSATLRRASQLLIEASNELVGSLVRRAREFAATPIVGRTHGMHAEPTTFGSKLALFALQADRDRKRLVQARTTISVGKLSGAVGTYSNVDPTVEAYVCESLELVPTPASQVIARDRHAQFLYAIASSGATIEAIATEIRLLQRSEVAEVEEPFAAGQKGSSAMPHKRNPVVSERLVGIARLLRGYLVTGLEDVALWHERDISHSSAERIVLPDATQLGYYALRRASWLIDGLVVDVERMRENLVEGSLGLVFSQSALLELVAAGLQRDAAYRIVQRAARRAASERIPLRDALAGDEELHQAIGEDALEPALARSFDLERTLRNAHRAVDALDKIES